MLALLKFKVSFPTANKILMRKLQAKVKLEALCWLNEVSGGLLKHFKMQCRSTLPIKEDGFLLNSCFDILFSKVINQVFLFRHSLISLNYHLA